MENLQDPSNSTEVVISIEKAVENSNNISLMIMWLLICLHKLENPHFSKK